MIWPSRCRHRVHDLTTKDVCIRLDDQPKPSYSAPTRLWIICWPLAIHWYDTASTPRAWCSRSSRRRKPPSNGFSSNHWRWSITDSFSEGGSQYSGVALVKSNSTSSTAAWSIWLRRNTAKTSSHQTGESIQLPELSNVNNWSIINAWEFHYWQIINVSMLAVICNI